MSTRTVVNLGPGRDSPAHAGESEAQALHRLAARAHERGIRLIVNQVTNHHFCTSASNRDKLHAVTLLSCDCRGFITHGRCMHFALVLERYGCLPPIVPDPSPDGGGAALPVPAPVVLSIVPARDRLDQTNRSACARYLDGDRDRAARWELTSALLGEDYFRAFGLTELALEAWCRGRLGLGSTSLVCPSPSCAGRGFFQSHPIDDGETCTICRGSGVVPGHSVAVSSEEVRHAA